MLAFWLKTTAQRSYYAKLDLEKVGNGWTVDYLVNRADDLYDVGD